MKKFILLSLFALLLIGCGSTRYIDRTDTIIRTDTIRVVPPALRDSLRALTDSLSHTVTAIKVVKGDTVVKIIYYPKTQTITYHAKPDTMIIYRQDTTSVSHTTTITKEPSWLQTNGMWLIAILAVMIILALVVVKVFPKF